MSSEVHSFRTFPVEKTTKPVNMIFGGDMGNRPVNADMNKVAASLDPYAAFLGGDIVYDNGYLECYCMYD